MVTVIVVAVVANLAFHRRVCHPPPLPPRMIGVSPKKERKCEMRLRRTIVSLAAAAGLALAVAGPVLVWPATSASANTSYFEWKNSHYGTCVVESGSNVVLGSCNQSHSAEWTSPGIGIGPQGGKEMKNEQSGKCLTVSGTAGAVHADACTGSHSQLWYNEAEQPGGGGSIQVVSTLYCLWGGSTHNVYQAVCNLHGNTAQLWTCLPNTCAELSATLAAGPPGQFQPRRG
jgi:hypothetical protein